MPLPENTAHVTRTYPTQARDLHEGFVVSLPAFPDRPVKVERHYRGLTGLYFVRFDTGNSGQFYHADVLFDVVSNT